MSDHHHQLGELSGTAILARAPRARALIDILAGTKLSLDGVWLVGGAVRDAVLDADAGPDIDLAVEGAGIAFAHLLASATGGEVVAEHSFGTASVRVDLGDPHGSVNVDVATCRTERYPEPGALPKVRHDALISDDLFRRDVSVNAIAVAMGLREDGEHELVDTQGGIADLADRRVRVLHDRSFIDDPTRIFRVARYAGRLGLRIDEATRALAIEAIRDGALGTISSERVRAELELVLREQSWDALTYLASWGVVERLDPRLEAAFHPPLLLRTLDEACGSDRDLNTRAWTLRLAALARPLGTDAAGWMTWLGFSSDVIDAAVGHIHVLTAVLDRGDELRALPNSGLYIELGEILDDSLALAALALDDDPQLIERLVAFSAAARDARLTIRGDDVIAAGVPAGPLVGRILGVLFLRTLDGELAGEADERAALAQLVAEAVQSIDEHAGGES